MFLTLLKKLLGKFIQAIFIENRTNEKFPRIKYEDANDEIWN